MRDRAPVRRLASRPAYRIPAPAAHGNGRSASFQPVRNAGGMVEPSAVNGDLAGCTYLDCRPAPGRYIRGRVSRRTTGRTRRICLGPSGTGSSAASPRQPAGPVLPVVDRRIPALGGPRRSGRSRSDDGGRQPSCRRSRRRRPRRRHSHCHARGHDAADGAMKTASRDGSSGRNRSIRSGRPVVRSAAHDGQRRGGGARNIASSSSESSLSSRNRTSKRTRSQFPRSWLTRSRLGRTPEKDVVSEELYAPTQSSRSVGSRRSRPRRARSRRRRRTPTTLMASSRLSGSAEPGTLE